MRPRHFGQRIATTLGLGLLLSALTPPATYAATGITLGSAAPDFTKTQLSGGPVSLSSYRGKVVLLFLLGYS